MNTEATASADLDRAAWALVLLAMIVFLLPRPQHDPDNPAGDIRRWLRS